MGLLESLKIARQNFKANARLKFSIFGISVGIGFLIMLISLILGLNQIAIEEIVGSSLNHLQVDKIFFLMKIILSILAAVSLLASSLSVINNIKISLLDRDQEIFVLKTIGFNKGQINRLFCFEAAFIGLRGSILGAISSNILIFLINLFSQKIISYNIFNHSLWFSLGLIILGTFIAAIAGLRPANKQYS